MSNQEPNAVEKLVSAYHRMVERLKHAIEEAEEHTAPNLQRNLERAKERAVELGELTREEAEKVAEYVRRDVQEAGSYLAETGHDLRDWLRVDLALIEAGLLNMFSRVADRSRLEMLEFQRALQEGPLYHTGEVAGPGVLACTACGQEVHFHDAGHIPPCPKCHGTTFRRPTPGK